MKPLDPKALEARIKAAFVSPKDERAGMILAGALVGIARQGYPSLVEDMLTISRRRAEDPISLYRLQMWMLQIVVPLEMSMREIKSRLDGAQSTAPPDQVLRLEQALFAHRLVIKAIRGVGDGIVWRALGSDRAAYYLLAQGHRQGAITSSGLPSEIQALAESAVAGEGLPILTSLTNCVRIGDLVYFSESAAGELSTTLAEVKTKEDRTPRFRRQRDRMRERVTLLNERAGKLEERDVSIAVRDIPQETYLASILNVLQEAASRGAAGRTFDNYLRVDCVVPDSPAVEERSAKTRQESAVVVEGWERRGDFVVDASNVEMKEFTPNIAPYSVYPLPDPICAGLLINTHWLRSFLNVSEVLRRFKERGWDVEEDPRERYFKTLNAGEDLREAHFALIRKGALTVTVPHLMCTRMLLEFLKPRSLIREMESILLAGLEAGKDNVLSCYPQERRTWL